MLENEKIILKKKIRDEVKMKCNDYTYELLVIDVLRDVIRLLEEENHSLKEENKSLKHQKEIINNKYLECKKENMEYYHLINCRYCKYHNYDWFDDGEEFEVCEKGNTERLFYNRFCEDYEEL